MKKNLFLFFLICFTANTFAQQAIQVGRGSIASFPPDAVAYNDGFFGHPYRWFELAWDELNLHESVRGRPIPTTGWWTDFIFRGLGRIQPTFHHPPVTLTTTGNRFDSQAWAYPHMVTASAEGFNMFFPQGFTAGNMHRGNPLRINASTRIQSQHENIVFADFESPDFPEGWRVTVNSHNIPGPMARWEITQSPAPTGFTGDRFINTFLGNAALFTMISPEFTIQHDYIHLRVGGGNHPNHTFAGLFINGERVRSATGENSGVLRQHVWNVSEFSGQTAEIRIVDNSTGGWGFIMADEIIFSNSRFSGPGYFADFYTSRANVYDWCDLGFRLRSENGGRYMLATILQGVPFLYVEMNDLFPILTPPVSSSVSYNASGQRLEDFPLEINAFTIEFENRVFGIHAPPGTVVHRSDAGNFQLEIPQEVNRRYVVVSVLPNRNLLAVYDRYARNKPGNVRFEYDYIVAEGRIVTTFDMNAVNLDNGSTNQPVLMSFLPHHWRTAERNFDFIPGADYLIFRGRMHSGAASSFTFSYRFGGMPPYLPEPLDMLPERKEMLMSLITDFAQRYTINANTYAKGLGENSLLMLMARSLNHPAFETIRDNLRNELMDWFTFDETRPNARFFTKYPNYGAVVGFPSGFGSQAFSDLHFHNGYFTLGAARLMMVCDEFKRDFAPMTKLITKAFANWERYEDGNSDVFMPFLRTFNPYLGHSWAGGTGDGGGNNQESSSEAINSWFGVYLLGMVLNDHRIMSTGAMGFLLEKIATTEYWLDIHQENFPPTYGRQYVGILRTDGLAWATYFSGDPAWILGIQACPTDFFFTHFGWYPEQMTRVMQAMFSDRVGRYPWSPTDDPFNSIRGIDAYLGGYLLGIKNFIDPETAADWIDYLVRIPGAEGLDWRRRHINTPKNYFLSNAMITYGSPARGFHTSIASGAVYKNARGELTYLLFNPSNEDIYVDIFKDGNIIETVRVRARQFYNSRLGKQPPRAAISSHRDNDLMALNKAVKVSAFASCRSGEVLWVDFYFDNQRIGTSYVEPFEQWFIPTASGRRELKAIATNSDGRTSEPSIVAVNVTTEEQTPFRNTPWNIPQETIFAVQFDRGPSGVAWHNPVGRMEGGDGYRSETFISTEGTGNIPTSNIGWTNAGMWIEYTVNVQAAGVYAMYGRVSSVWGAVLQVDFDGNRTENLTIPPTGSWGAYQNVFFANIPLQAGRQIMRVTVISGGANLSSYNFTLRPDINMPSTVNAGGSQVIFYPQNAVTLLASAATFGSTTIQSYEWRQIGFNPSASIISPNAAETRVENLGLGRHIFEITITDSNGNAASDRAAVIVRPQFFPPVANPGNSRTVSAGETIVLDGSLSYSPNGTIVGFQWEQIDANNLLAINQGGAGFNPLASVSGFEPNRVYVIRLTVTDSQGASASNNVRIFSELQQTDLPFVPEDGSKMSIHQIGSLIVINANVEITSAAMFSISGRQVAVTLNGNQIDTSALASGVYLLQVNNTNVFRVIVR